MIKIYTDGGCSPNPGKGGWAALLMWEKHQKLISGCYQQTTNNRMELIAIIEALQALKTTDIPVILYTDSNYVASAFNRKWIDKWKSNNWKKLDNSPVLNKDLMITLDKLVSNLNIQFKWVLKLIVASPIMSK